MKNFTKKAVFIAVIGACVFALQSHNSSLTSADTAREASLTSVSAIEPVTASADAVASKGIEIAGAELAPIAYDYAANDGDASVETGFAQPAAREARKAETDTAAAQQRIARAKMSGPVAALAMAGGPEPADIVVSYHDHPELFEDGRVEELGGEVLRHYEVLDLLAIRIPAESLIELAVEDDVKRVSLDETVVTSSTILKTVANVPSYDSSNSSYKGDDQTVAILDTGVASHGDLYDKVRQYSFLNGNYPKPEIDDDKLEKYNSSAQLDEFGHGTHIAGVVAGSGRFSSGDYEGPALQADILSLQVLDGNGHGQMSDVMAALDWLLQYGEYFDVRVANLSFGKPITESNTTDPLVAAVEAVWDSGIVVVAAAGNYGREGYFSTTSPGNSRKIITVGSLTDNGTGPNFDDDYVSTYSSRGPTVEDHVVKPDLVAPGNRLIATAPRTSVLAKLLPDNVVACTSTSTSTSNYLWSSSSGCNEKYLELSGTSMATGVVSAAAAMMLDKEPWLSPATVKARLMRSARKLDESPIVAGAGLLDIDAAMNETGVVSGQALSPLMSFDSATGGTLVQDTASLWGNDLWGAGYLWTDGGGVSSNGYLWTDGGVNASGYLWTDGEIWANGYLWTDGGVAAFGYLWTDGVNATGYVWTDGGVNSNGYLWTDGGGVGAKALYDDLDSANPSLNDDAPTSD